MISEVLLLEPLHVQRKPERPKKTYTEQLKDDRGFSTDELKTAMGGRDMEITCHDMPASSNW